MILFSGFGISAELADVSGWTISAHALVYNINWMDILVLRRNIDVLKFLCMPNDCKLVTSPSETFKFLDERLPLLFVGLTMRNTNRERAAVLEPVYREDHIRPLAFSS